MKRLCTLVLLLTCGTLLFAQQERLATYPVFQGTIVPRNGMVETMIKGENIEDLGLTFFHSVKCAVGGETLAVISDLVLKDAQASVTRRTVMVDGLVQSAFLKMPEKGYLAFQFKKGEDTYDIVLLYMEGEMTEKQMKKLFGIN